VPRAAGHAHGAQPKGARRTAPRWSPYLVRAARASSSPGPRRDRKLIILAHAEALVGPGSSPGTVASRRPDRRWKQTRPRSPRRPTRSPEGVRVSGRSRKALEPAAPGVGIILAHGGEVLGDGVETEAQEHGAAAASFLEDAVAHEPPEQAGARSWTPCCSSVETESAPRSVATRSGSQRNLSAPNLSSDSVIESVSVYLGFHTARALDAGAESTNPSYPQRRRAPQGPLAPLGWLQSPGTLPPPSHPGGTEQENPCRAPVRGDMILCRTSPRRPVPSDG
jgi:hypothetical protein